MLKLRRRAAAAASGLPFCGMCGTTMRVDPDSRRCALGHRIIVAGTLLAAAADERATVPAVSEPVVSHEVGSAFQSPITDYAMLAGAHIDDPATGDADMYADYLNWDEPASALSSLDVDTTELPVLPLIGAAEGSAADSFTPILVDLLDDLDEAKHARRRAAGTIGAAVAASALAVASVAVLPF